MRLRSDTAGGLGGCAQTREMQVLPLAISPKVRDLDPEHAFTGGMFALYPQIPAKSSLHHA